ncbi:lysophospholipid acyltransferase family protein [Altererythrobacter sp.]|uniref:lysophospholipid acyltransferase family protein n=1 Tax=Altererythrobacter sp. TaxID=1872480 RepID=UPI003D142D15
MIVALLREAVFALTRFLVGGHPRWIGCGPDEHQRIYFANHASHLDTIILWAALPVALRRVTHPVAAADYWGTGAIKRFIALRVLNAVLVERTGSRDPLSPLRAELERGHSLVIFPEGTRRQEILPGKFKSGLYHLAKDYPDAELVPVYLSNLARAYPKGAIVPAPISSIASFGTPLSLESGEDKEGFLTRAHEAVCALAEGNAA